MMAPMQIEAAREELSRVVRDDQSGASRIDTYIKEGLEWRGWWWRGIWRRQYRPQNFEWCGAFAAWCMAHAGLSYAVRKKHLASCYRLFKWSKGNERKVEPHLLQAGDICVMGPEPATKDAPRRLRKQRPRWGKHIALVERVLDGKVQTIEGNAHGTLGDGTRGEGVVRAERPLSSTNPRTYRILYGVRPLTEEYSD